MPRGREKNHSGEKEVAVCLCCGSQVGRSLTQEHPRFMQTSLRHTTASPPCVQVSCWASCQREREEGCKEAWLMGRGIQPRWRSKLWTIFTPKWPGNIAQEKIYRKITGWGEIGLPLTFRGPRQECECRPLYHMLHSCLCVQPLLTNFLPV